MRINRVVLSNLEYQWLSNNVHRTKKILEKAAEKDPTVKDRVTYKTLATVETLFPILEDETKSPSEVMLTVKQKQVLANMVMTTMLVLNDKIMPEYQRRGLTEYLDDVKMKSSLLKGLHKKLQ